MAIAPAIDAALRGYRGRLEAEFVGRVVKLVLFGSVARGHASEGSDVDVLVVVDTLTGRERARAIDLATEEALDRGLLIEPVVLTAAEWDELGRRERLFRSEVEREGIEL